MKKMKSFLAVALCAVLFLSVFAGCSFDIGSNDIVILFTGGVANKAEGSIGYSSVAAYRRYVSESHNFVTLLDCGNSLSGGTMDLVAKGEYSAKIMAEVGYDFYALGDRDFSLGTENLQKASSEIGAKLLSVNAVPDDDEEFPVISSAKEVFASKTVGFIGVTAPVSYELKGVSFSSGSELADDVQSEIDSLKNDCDYIILVSSLGKDAAKSLVEKIRGADAVLDAEKSGVPEKIILDADGKKVVYSSAGKELHSIGQLVITSSGTLIASNVSFYEKDEDVDLLIETLNKKYKSQLEEVIATAESGVPITNTEYEVKTIENRETPIGNLVADAYAAAAGAQIAFVSADEIEYSLDAGEIRLENILSVIPGGNKLAVAELSGAQIADALEFAVKDVDASFFDPQNSSLPYGTFAGFLQVSGVSFAIKTYTESTVVLNDDGSFKEISGERRVTDLKVKNENGEYEAIDPEKTYTVAGIESLLSGERNGNTVFTADSIVNDNAGEDYNALINFIKDTLQGDLSAYAAKGERIVIQTW